MDINERVGRLEVIVHGNGEPGLSRRVQLLHDRQEKDSDRIDQLEFIVNQAVTREGCIVNQEKVREVVAKEIERAFNNRQHTGLRWFLEWVIKVGPLLAGAAALIGLLIK